MARRIFGVDFSGAIDAGRRIWLAEGRAEGRDFRLIRLLRGSELPGSGRDRPTCLSALARFIVEKRDAVFALDFPFGLPRAVVPESTWEGFLRGFLARYPDAATFKTDCVRRAQGRDLKRRTDRETKAPFCPYNLRMYHQTFHGIYALLAPLVLAGQAVAPPMTPQRPGLPVLLEICPASALKTWGLYGTPYKGNMPAHVAARRAILNGLRQRRLLTLDVPTLGRIFSDPGGDALDALVAALACFHVLRDPATLLETNEDYAIEARVFVPRETVT